MAAEVEEESFYKETIEDVEGSIARFFLGACRGRGDPSVEEEDPVIQAGKLYGQDYEQLKVTYATLALA